ncbi:MAG TPA: hypothetical protein VL346_07980 [Acidobacteriaceae bacterium]|nr:hypothetical protein [Acidobacteriaceae bacterium]
MQKEKTLARLSRLRQMEEEMSRLDLEAAVVERERLFRYWQAASNARGAGRRSFSESVEEGDGAARQSSLMAMEQSRRRQESFAAMLNSADRAIEQLRANFLARRTATRQAETLMQEARAERHADDARRLQQMLDDWFGHRNRLASASSARQERRRDGRAPRLEGAEKQLKD